MSSVVRYSGHYNLILRTIQYYIPKLLYSVGIQHGAVRMSQKNENNSAESNSRNSSSEESGDKKRTDNNKPKNNTTNIREENHTRSEAMVATIYSVCQNDPENRPEYNDNRQRDIGRISRRTGDENKTFLSGHWEKKPLQK